MYRVPRIPFAPKSSEKSPVLLSPTSDDSMDAGQERIDWMLKDYALALQITIHSDGYGYGSNGKRRKHPPDFKADFYYDEEHMKSAFDHWLEFTGFERHELMEEGGEEDEKIKLVDSCITTRAEQWRRFMSECMPLSMRLFDMGTNCDLDSYAEYVGLDITWDVFYMQLVVTGQEDEASKLC